MQNNDIEAIKQSMLAANARVEEIPKIETIPTITAINQPANQIANAAINDLATKIDKRSKEYRAQKLKDAMVIEPQYA